MHITLLQLKHLHVLCNTCSPISTSSGFCLYHFHHKPPTSAACFRVPDFRRVRPTCQGLRHDILLPSRSLKSQPLDRLHVLQCSIPHMRLAIISNQFHCVSLYCSTSLIHFRHALQLRNNISISRKPYRDLTVCALQSTTRL